MENEPTPETKSAINGGLPPLQTPEERFDAAQKTLVREFVRDFLDEGRPHAEEWEFREHGTAEQMAEFDDAMALAQADFGTPKKTQKKTIRTRDRGSYDIEWAPLVEIYKATKPALAKQGFTVWQPVSGPDPEGRVRVTTRLRRRGAYVEAILSFKDVPSMQDLGARITYAKRYALNAMLALDADEDFDEGPGDQDQRRPQQQPPAMPEGNGQPRQQRSQGGQQRRQEQKPQPAKPPPPAPQDKPPEPDPRQTAIQGSGMPNEQPPPEPTTRPTNEKPEPPQADLPPAPTDNEFDELQNTLVEKLNALGWPQTKIATWFNNCLEKSFDQIINDREVNDLKVLIASADSHLAKAAES